MRHVALTLPLALCLAALPDSVSWACTDAGVLPADYVEIRTAWPGEGDAVPPDAWVDISLSAADDDFLDRLHVEATADGAPISGRLALRENHHLRFWWKPDAPWPAGTAVTLTVWVDDDREDAEERRFTITDGPGPAPRPLAEVQLDACIAQVVTAWGPCDTSDSCGCRREPEETTLRAQIEFEVPDNIETSRRGYRVEFGVGATPEEAEAAVIATLSPGWNTARRLRADGAPDAQQCLALRRLDGSDTIIDRHTTCAVPAERCAGAANHDWPDPDQPDPDQPDPAEQPSGCAQSTPEGPGGASWLLLTLLLLPAARRRAR